MWILCNPTGLTHRCDDEVNDDFPALMRTTIDPNKPATYFSCDDRRMMSVSRTRVKSGGDRLVRRSMRSHASCVVLLALVLSAVVRCSGAALRGHHNEEAAKRYTENARRRAEYIDSNPTMDLASCFSIATCALQRDVMVMRAAAASRCDVAGSEHISYCVHICDELSR